MAEVSRAGQSFAGAQRRQPRAWKTRVLAITGALLVALLALGAIMNIVIAARMVPALRMANGAMTKMDTMYGAFAQAVKILCAIPDNGLPPPLWDLLCTSKPGAG